MVKLKKKDAKKENPAEAQGLLSQKLDNLLKEAKIDGSFNGKPWKQH